MRDDTAVVDDHLAALAAALVPYRAAADRLAAWGSQLAWTLGRGGRLLVAGNGGSAAEAQHLAAELIGRLREDRAPLSAIALCADSAAVTAISNDYGFEHMFARQVRGHGRPGDILVVLSTSGRSPNLLAAVTAAREGGMRTWALTGPAPNPLAAACDESITCPSTDSQVVQELHLVSVHLICEYVDRTLPVVLGSGTRPDASGRDTSGPSIAASDHDPIAATALAADRIPDLVGRSAGAAHGSNGYGGRR
jgi:D-sedoheptulose 7-phosphate isomerase